MRIIFISLALALVAGAALAQPQQSQPQPQPRIAGPGEYCNGTTWPPTLCREGLECRVPPRPGGSPPLVGAGGTCQPVPQRCSLSVYPPLTCPTGQNCVSVEGAPPGSPGQCRPNP